MTGILIFPYLRSLSEGITDGRGNNVGIGIVALEAVGFRLTVRRIFRSHHAGFRLHYDEIVTNVDAQIFKKPVSGTKADDVTISGRKHCRTVGVSRWIPVVGIADSAAERISKIIFETESDAPGIMPIELRSLTFVLSEHILRQIKVDMVDCAPFRPCQRCATAELFGEIVVGSERN